METLVVFAQHRNQFHGRIHGSNHGFREINCRSFQSGAGASMKARSSAVRKQSPSANVVYNQIPFDKNPKHSKNIAKSSSIPIPISINHVDYAVNDNINGSMNGFFYSERWAGPAYSNSPPPSSVPIPNFSVKPKRTVSLDLPSISSPDVDLLALISKSAPTSPTSDPRKCSQTELFNTDGDSATKTLCRLLNLH